MTSSNGIIFRVTGSLRGETTGHRWIPPTKAKDTELWRFFDLRLNIRLSKHRDAGDLRRHRAHHDVIIMICRYRQNTTHTKPRGTYWEIMYTIFQTHCYCVNICICVTKNNIPGTKGLWNKVKARLPTNLPFYMSSEHSGTIFHWKPCFPNSCY